MVDGFKPHISVIVDAMSQPAKQTEALFITERIRRGVPIFMIVCLGVAMLVLCLSLTVYYFYDRHQAASVKSVEPVGKVMAVTLTNGLFTRAVVETDVGFYVLVGAVSLNKNKPLTLEVRVNSERYLCDEAKRCTKLLEWW